MLARQISPHPQISIRHSFQPAASITPHSCHSILPSLEPCTASTFRLQPRTSLRCTAVTVQGQQFHTLDHCCCPCHFVHGRTKASQSTISSPLQVELK